MQSKRRFGRFVRSIFSYSILGLLFFSSCNKLVTVPNPISSVTTTQVFSSDATATSAMMGVYSYMSQNPAFSNFQTTYLCGKSADELTDETGGNEIYDDFLVNKLTALNDGPTVLGAFWQSAYFDIYSANAVIAGLQSSTGVSSATRNQLTGEAEFVRAFCYFYLTNIFGDVPLDLNIDFNQTVLLPSAPQAKIYQQILSDLQNAQTLMISDFSLSNGWPIRANKWAATALLARVYLYRQNWDSAYLAANAVINSRQFSLVPLPLIPADGVPGAPSNGGPAPLSDSDVFAANSAEAILQLQTVNTWPYATQEGNFFVPYDSNSYANCWLTSQLLGAFEPNDLRRIDWVYSTDPGGNGIYYYCPYKYQIMAGNGWPAAENYTLLRLAEQYLIRAEAEANGAGGGSGAAISDLDTIRGRANLAALSPTMTGDSLMAAVQQEWRIEFFAEWGHRWLDLKRWGKAVGILDSIPYKKGRINSNQLLYPIPLIETQTDPNLTQNPGYN